MTTEAPGTSGGLRHKAISGFGVLITSPTRALHREMKHTSRQAIAAGPFYNAPTPDQTRPQAAC